MLVTDDDFGPFTCSNLLISSHRALHSIVQATSRKDIRLLRVLIEVLEELKL